ncbi:MAG: hypothetical protein ABI778_01585 [Ignavibacteriota bacterium]
MFRIIKGIAFFIIFIFLFGFISMSLWNALVPELFHGPVITYWQALGLLLLGKIFFGGFHGGHHRRHHCSPRHKHWMGEWENDYGTYKSWKCWGKDWEEKYKNMSAEEREEWKKNDMKMMWRSAKDKMDEDTKKEM